MCLKVVEVCQNSRLPYVNGEINGKSANILVDTGAEVTLVDEELIKDTKAVISDTHRYITGVTGAALNIVGEVNLEIKIGDEECTHKCLVVRSMMKDMIMGMDLIRKRGYKLDFSDVDQVAELENGVEFKFKSRIKIPARSSKFIWAKPMHQVCEVIEAWVKPTCLKYGVQVRESISPVNEEGEVLVHIINENSYPVKVERATKVTADVDFMASVSHVKTQDWKTEEVLSESEKRGTKDGYQDNECNDRAENVLKEMNLSYLTQRQMRIIQRLVERKSKVFALDGEKLPFTHLAEFAIHTGDALPIRKRPYRIPESQKKDLKENLEQLKREGIIRESNSPWAAPCLLIKKKLRGFRLCIDYRSLNNIITKSAYPLPHIHDLLDSVQNSKVFSVIDLKSGYHQIPVKKEHVGKTAFVCSLGQFEYLGMPQGIQPAAGTFQQFLEARFSDLLAKNVLLYIDDIMIHSENEEDHEKDLEEVLRRLEEAGLSVKPSKCQFFKQKCSYLGHEVSAEGIAPNKEKVRVINNYPIPKDLEEVRRFIGMCSYYRRFVKDFAEKARPLTDMNKKGRLWQWGIAEQKAFEVLKKHLMEAPILAYPRFDDDSEFILFTDASKVSVGCVLSQIQDSVERVISYGSKRLSDEETRYSTTEQECLAIVKFTEEYRCYLLGRPFRIVSDHRPLQWLKSLKNPVGRLGRWAVSLSQFNYEIKYRPGRVNENADALSRLTINEVEEEKEEPEEELSTAKIKIAQNKDKWCRGLINFIRRKELPKDDEKLSKIIVLEADRHHIRRDGVLTILPDNKLPIAMSTEAKPPVVLPESLRPEIMRVFHDHKTAGHLGFLKTYKKIQQRYYFKGMYTYIEDYVKNCRSCLLVKTPPIVRRGLCARFSKTCRPMQKLCLDFLGPLITSYKGNKAILVITDDFSKFAEAIALPDMKTPTLAEALIDRFFTKFGFCDLILTDRGSSFRSKLMKDIAKLCQIKWVYSSPFSPRTQSVTERYNKTLVSMLTHYVQDDPKEWDTYVSYACHAYNTSYHNSTNFTPYELMYGRQAILPIDVISKEPEKTYNTAKDYRREVAERLYLTHQEALLNSEEAKKQQDKYYNQKSKHRNFECGDIVYIVNKKVKKKDKSRKFRTKFIGPYQIVQKICDVTFRLKDEYTGKTELCNVDRMKLGRYIRTPHPTRDATLEGRDEDSDEERDTGKKKNEELKKPRKVTRLRSKKLEVRPRETRKIYHREDSSDEDVEDQVVGRNQSETGESSSEEEDEAEEELEEGEEEEEEDDEEEEAEEEEDDDKEQDEEMRSEDDDEERNEETRIEDEELRSESKGEKKVIEESQNSEDDVMTDKKVESKQKGKNEDSEKTINEDYGENYRDIENRVGKQTAEVKKNEKVKKNKSVSFPCGVCGLGVGSNSIFCSVCAKWIHNKCTGVDKDVENFTAKEIRKFSCTKCRGKDKNMQTKVIEERLSDQLPQRERFRKTNKSGDKSSLRENHQEISRMAGKSRFEVEWPKFIAFGEKHHRIKPMDEEGLNELACQEFRKLKEEAEYKLTLQKPNWKVEWEPIKSSERMKSLKKKEQVNKVKETMHNEAHKRVNNEISNVAGSIRRAHSNYNWY